MKIIWPVILTVREWQFVMVFRWKWHDPKAYIWSRTTMPRYRRWKRTPDLSAGWEY